MLKSLTKPGQKPQAAIAKAELEAKQNAEKERLEIEAESKAKTAKAEEEEERVKKEKGVNMKKAKLRTKQAEYAAKIRAMYKAAREAQGGKITKDQKKRVRELAGKQAQMNEEQAASIIWGNLEQWR
jgi:hypothetical protein